MAEAEASRATTPTFSTLDGGYVVLFLEHPDNPEDQRWEWELFQGSRRVDGEYAKTLDTCRRECVPFWRMDRLVAGRAAS